MSEEEYEKLMATLERIEKAGTLADIVSAAPDPSWEDTAPTMPTIYGEDSFKRIHSRVLINMAFALQRLEKEAGMIKYFDGYCRHLYENYKPREKEIKHPDILKFIKDYENHYKGGEEMSVSTTNTIIGAIDNLTNAELYLLDATDVDCSEEGRELRRINNSLVKKLAIATEQEMKGE